MISMMNDPNVMPREQSRRPRRYFAPRVKHRVEQQQAERIRGGCIVCLGGSIWTLSCCGGPGGVFQDDPPQQLPPMQQVSRSTPVLPVEQLGTRSPSLDAPSPLLPPLTPLINPSTSLLGPSRPHSRQSDSPTLVESHQPFPSKSRESLWQRWRKRIFTRPRGPNKAGE